MNKRFCELNFTGNWFIDAGIIGFINLMEEVYGWGLNELKQKVKKEKEKIIYGYFPVAYVCYANSENSKASDFKISGSDPKEIWEEAWEFIKRNFKEKKRNTYTIKIPDSGKFNYFKNFLFFQPMTNMDKKKSQFEEILGLKKIEEKVLKNFDKTLNKLLASASEFNNVFYGKMRIPEQYLLFLICFPLAFNQIKKEKKKRKYENVFFYSPNLIFCYKINKSLKLQIKKAEVEGRKQSILDITWEAVVDNIWELESIWALENMYLIKYKLGEKQRIMNVEYIGLSKLQAQLIIDDNLRKSINKEIKIGEKEEETAWLLEEFVRNKPLLPILYKNLLLHFTNGSNLIGKNTAIYGAAIDKLLGGEIIEEWIFTANIYSKQKQIYSKLKEIIGTYFSISAEMERLFGNNKKEENKKIAYQLFSFLRRNNKFGFSNVLLKEINKLEQKENIEKLMRYIFNNILNANSSWQPNGFVLVIGLLL